jgi:hypothetical protein
MLAPSRRCGKLTRKDELQPKIEVPAYLENLEGGSRRPNGTPVMRDHPNRMAVAVASPYARPRPSSETAAASRWSRHVTSAEAVAEAVPRASETKETVKAAQSPLPLPAAIFLVALQIPWIFSVGDLRLAPYRLVLLIMLPICFFQWLMGKAGRIRLTDVALLLFCGWCALAMAVVHGFETTIEPAGMLFIETMGGYLLARCYVRREEHFLQIAKLLFAIAAILLPFALYETSTGNNLTLGLFSMVLPTYVDVDMPLRWGLDRVQGNNIHPIHFGVAVASTLTLTHLVLGYGRSTYERCLRSGVVFITAFLALSSGPITSMVGQFVLLGWNRALRSFPRKWTIMALGGLGMVIFVELFANRSLPVILIGYFAFDEASAYIRTLTWQYGTQSILNHPLWGVGFGPWDKPTWLTPSIDMHWIIDSVRHGMPAGFFILLAFFSAVFAIGRVPISDERIATYRLAYVVTMASFFMTGWAVYLWETSYSFFTFMLGSGFWLLETKAQSHRADGKAVPSGRTPKPKTGADAPRRPQRGLPAEP